MAYLREVKLVHEEYDPGAPVCPHAAAERIGINPVGRWYAAMLEYPVEERVLAPGSPQKVPGEDEGDRLDVPGEGAPRLPRS